MQTQPGEQDFDDFAASAMPRLRVLAYAWCGDWHHSDDVVQDTMERLYAAWPRVRRRGEQYAYARTTLVRRLISENRRAWRRHETATLDQAGDEAASTHPRTGDSAEDSSQRLDVLHLLRHLPARQRAVAVLRFVEDLPVSDVADLLHCSEGTVKSQAHHARRLLQQHLGGEHSAASAAPAPAPTHPTRPTSRGARS